MKKGDWVSDFGSDIPQLGRICGTFELDGVLYINVVLYDREGTRLGRVSPALGGPRKFEPALDGRLWTVIERPSFPLPITQIDDDRGRLRFGITPHLRKKIS